MGNEPETIEVVGGLENQDLPDPSPRELYPETKAAKTVPQPDASNLPPATSKLAQDMLEKGMQVVGAERDGGHLFITIEGDEVEDVQGPDARKLAYDSRYHYGWANAGIEIWAGPAPVVDEDKEPVGRYQQTWRLTRGM